MAAVIETKDQNKTAELDSIAEKQTNVLPAPLNDESPKPSLVKKTIVFTVTAAAIVSCGIFGYQFYQHLVTHEETDDAYVTGHLHQVSTRINDTVAKVLVDDNEHVKQGQVIVVLDPRDYQVKVDQALADLKAAELQAGVADKSIELAKTTALAQDTSAQGGVENAKATIARALASVEEARSNIKSNESDLKGKAAEVERAKADYQRYESLEKERAVTTSSRDSAKRDFVVSEENYRSAQDAVKQSKARLAQALEQVNVAKASLMQSQGQVQLAQASNVQTSVNRHQFTTQLANVEKAKATLEEARLNLSYTKIVAPTTGRIGKKTVEDGQRIEPGQPLMTIVSDNLWVVANYKETQLKQMHAGQVAEITIDSFNNHKFEGVVQSFSPASGASFAVLPSDNATGNFTKIVQRLPVKIILTKESTKGYEDKLAPGMSCVISIDITK